MICRFLHTSIENSNKSLVKLLFLLFFKDYREKGIPASEVPPGIVDPLVAKVMNAPQEMLLSISEVFDYDLHEAPHGFNSYVCDECGEMTVIEYGRLKMVKKVCQDCAAK